MKQESAKPVKAGGDKSKSRMKPSSPKQERQAGTPALLGKERQARRPALPEEGKPRIPTSTFVYLFLALVAGLGAGVDFVEQRAPEPVHPSVALSHEKRLSDYLPSLRGTRMESDVYIFDGREPGGTLLILGGTHPNEPASNVAAVLLLENIQVEAGRVIIIPRANASGFTATEPQEAFPPRFELVNRRGKLRRFQVGSRFTNILDGWPDPVVYRHYPSGQILSGNETRNLNRAYPGRKNGTLTEMAAYAITTLVKDEKVDLVIDLHEAAPEYPVINAIVAHDRAMDVASMAAVDLQAMGLDFRLEPSPDNFRGLSHRELGDHTDARAILLESTGALQGRIRGRTDQELIVGGRDPIYRKAFELGKLAVDFPEEGVPLEVRVGRHLEAVQIICRYLSEFYPDRQVVYARTPGYEELVERGVGFFLK